MTTTKTSENDSPRPDFAGARSDRRVVITGLGVVNPLGLTLDSFWEALLQGRSGIRPIQLFDCSELPIRFAGEIPDFNGKQYIDKKERKNMRVMARAIQMAVAAAQLALDDSGVDKSQLDPTRFGVEFGSGLMATELIELAGAAEVSASGAGSVVDMKKWGSEGIPRIPPLWMLKYLPNMLACHVSILHNAQGPNNTITESDVASLLALGESYHIIRRNQADFFLAGGADSKLNPLSWVRQCLFGKLSPNNEKPAEASRPFDRRRNGLVIGEGSGVLVLEDLSHARSRGARIYGEIVGFGASFDRDHSGKGLARSMRTALADAQLSPDQIDHINPNGMSTQYSDKWEARGIQEVFGNTAKPVPVWGTKSYFGNLGAGSGTSELIASILACKNGTLPATLNYLEPDPECPVSIRREPQPIGSPYVMKISFTDMGQCAALIYRNWEWAES